MALDLRLLEVLSIGQISLSGQFSWGSNHTYLVEVAAQGASFPAVYKPAAGERPLWDFPGRTLAQREVAAYLACQAMGWDLVPPTVLRPDGPNGGGSLQLYLNWDPERHYFTFSEREKQLLRPVALFDVLANNADRKAGHVLLGDHDQIRIIDHGLCFHEEYKLRTVIWDFAGEPIPVELLERLDHFEALLAAEEIELSSLLSPDELIALRSRAQQLKAEGCFPTPSSDRNFPWPLV